MTLYHSYFNQAHLLLDEALKNYVDSIPRRIVSRAFNSIEVGLQGPPSKKSSHPVPVTDGPIEGAEDSSPEPRGILAEAQWCINRMDDREEPLSVDEAYAFQILMRVVAYLEQPAKK